MLNVLDVASCERVEAVARRHPERVAMIGFVRRFDDSYLEAKAQIDAGRVGRPFLVRSQTCDKNDPDLADLADCADCGDVDNGLAIVEFEGGARAQFFASRTMAHGLDTATEVIGTAGSVSVGVGGHRGRVQSRDTGGVHHRVLVDFVERFAEAFQREMAAFVAACKKECPVPLSLSDATEATRIGVAVTKSLPSGQVERVA